MELKTFVAQDSTGSVIPGATATLYVTGTDQKVEGLTDQNDQPIDNPMVTDANGVIKFKAPNGIYDLQFNLGPLPGPRYTFQCLDLVAQIAAVDDKVATASGLVDEAKLIMDRDIYASVNAALADPNLPNGAYFRIVGNNTSGAFLYYRKNSASSSTSLVAIPTASQVNVLNSTLANAVNLAMFNAVIKQVDPIFGDKDILYAVRDSAGYQTWLGVSAVDGGPSAYAEKMLRDRFGIQQQKNFLAAGEEISWAVTDKNGNLTDLAIRAIDGQLAQYAVNRIGDRIAGGIKQDVAKQIDPMKIPRDAPGFQVLASMSRWAAQRGRGESITSPINFTTPINNQNARLTFANTPYSNDGPMLMIIYFGGVGSGPTLTPPPEYASLANDGIIWARCNFEGDHYGSPKCMEDVANVYTQACKLAPIGGVLLLGNSMGGMGALNALLTGVVPGVLGLYLTDPVCNLFDRYNSSRQGLIQTAYGIASNGSDYSTKTAGYDPVLRHWTDFRGAPVYCIASTGDDLVPMATNAQLLYDTFSQHVDMQLEVHTTAGHNTADRFDPIKLRDFIRKVCYGTILK